LGGALVEKGEPRKSGTAVTTVVQTCLNGQRSPHDEDPPAWMGLGWNNTENEPALVSLAVGNEERARRAAVPDRLCCSPQASQRGMARSSVVPPDVLAPVAAFPDGPEPPRPVQPAMHPIEMATKS